MSLSTKLLSYRLRKYKPNHPMSFNVGKYTVKIADTPEEVCEALRLRYRIFYGKYKGRALPFCLDMTPFEKDADHLIVKEADRIIGAYRLRCSQFTRKFFSASEFALDYIQDRLIDQGSVCLELGRACVDTEKRQGLVIACLWKGILRYAKELKVSHLFGCVSVQSDDPKVARAICTYLDNNGLSVVSEHSIAPLPQYAMKMYYSAEGGDRMIPPLFQSYLKMGCKVYGNPAYDPHFKCIDFFTMLQLTDMDPAFERKLS